MTNKMKKAVLILSVLILASAFVWAGSGRDAGAAIVIGQWWEGYDVNTMNPSTENEEQWLAWRKRVVNQMGYNIREENTASWDSLAEVASTTIMAGNPAAQAFFLLPGWAMGLQRQNLLAPLSDSRAINMSNTQDVPFEKTGYNQTTREAFTFGGKVYAMTPNNGVGGNYSTGIFFNKRLFREAGLDAETPYNMQRDGTWTWDNFLDICRRLTRDTRNSGRVNQWAFPLADARYIMSSFIISNGGEVVAKDAQGRFVNASGRPESLEAINFIRRLYSDGVILDPPEGAAWDWMLAAFTEGRVAMIFEMEWRHETWRPMADDWGYVLPPKGPRAPHLLFPVYDNVVVVPSTYTGAALDRIVTGLDLWYRNPNADWASWHWGNWRDTRTVNETLNLVYRTPGYGRFQNEMLIPGLDIGEIAWNMYWREDPGQLVESVGPNWNNLIRNVNQ